MSGPRLISESVPKVADKVFSRKYIMLGRLLTRWEDIVGPDLATKTQPVKIKGYRSRTKKRREKPQATLEIATSTADATLLHYQKDLILERINQIFGDSWISAIRFVPVASNAPASKTQRKLQRPLNPEEKSYLSDALGGIGDEDLEKRLAKLGEAILQERSS